ncbi:M50 family metallopeptidase [Actinomycetospora endophytica]|uniref:M50 family metallopeptidase n=1 Tax=Actinomycetospora endophytica TaxID=2291215 RepID=A0ABS8PC05_9PSEU|nr:M50 family metallopeptidase [Actinomycetospora endophytica]MCD2195035.1 M50 family metallopeptidase [Actinomycetospora endophytica]
MDDLIGVPVVGQPVVYAAGFIALLLVVFTGSWAGSLVTLAHEGGHALTSVLALRGLYGVHLEDGGGGFTRFGGGWGASLYVIYPAGYLTPPLLGLGGAAVLVDGNAWGVLVGAVVILAVSFLVAANALANVVAAVASVGVIAALVWGPATLQVALAVVVVWWLLLGGVRSTVRMGRSSDSDAGVMSRLTLIPPIIWQAFWVTVALVCLYAGGRLLLVGTAWPPGVWPFGLPA